MKPMILCERDVPAADTLRAWLRRFRRPRCPADAACVLDGRRLDGPRRAVGSLAEKPGADDAGAILLLDHAHPGAIEALRSAQASHPQRFDAGTVVIGVENLTPDEADALAFYRRVARAPVFAVDPKRTTDLLLLREALVAQRVVVGVLRRAQGVAG